MFSIVEYKIYLFIVILLNEYFIDMKKCRYFAFNKTIMSSPNSITFIFYPICIEFAWCRIFTYILNVIIPVKNETVFFFFVISSSI